MMVIQQISDGRIYPADRCTWIEEPNTTNGYGVTSVMFYPGDAAAETVGPALLGYIGKTGRFVGMTV